MSEKPKSITDEQKNKKSPRCFKYQAEESGTFSTDLKKSAGTLCFDTDEKTNILSKLLTSDEERQCLSYQMHGRDLIKGGLEKKKVTLCLEKQSPDEQ